MENRRAVCGIGGIIGLFMLIIDNKTAYLGACEGIKLCTQVLIPALFPFIIVSSVLSSSFSGQRIPLLSGAAKLFGIPCGCEYFLITGFFSGYPVGAQSIASAYHSGSISRQQAQRLITYCSNAGPAFLFGVVSQMFDNIKTVWCLWGIHIFSAWLVSLLLPVCDTKDPVYFIKDKPQPPIMQNSVKAMGLICGWVVLFRVLIQFLSRWCLWSFSQNIKIGIVGLLELSNGCSMLHVVENHNVRFLLCSIFLAFGGFCVTMQTSSIIQDLSIKDYLTGKIIQTYFSVLLSILYLTKSAIILPFFAFPYIISYPLKKFSRNPEKTVV